MSRNFKFFMITAEHQVAPITKLLPEPAKP